MAEDNRANLLKLVQEHCTRHSIHRLLKAAKDMDATVRLSAKNKEIFINTNLRHALDSGAISVDQVCAELYDAEENGGQHVFYFKSSPAWKAKEDEFGKYIAGPAVAARKFGANWQQVVGEPKFHLRPVGTLWSNFRITSYPEGQHGWIAKAYGGVNRKKFLEERLEKRQDGNRLHKTWEIYLAREVYLAKWHPFGVLEIRVPMAESRQEVIESLKAFWKMLEPGIRPADFTEWDLSGARCNIKEQAPKNKKLYRLGPVRLMDKQQGATTVCPPSSEEDVCSDPSRAATLTLFKECPFLVMTWLPNGQLEDDLRAVIGKLSTNEVLLTAKATADAVNYVTYRLREFAA